LIRVRDPFPKSSYLPIVPILRDFETGLRDIVDLNDSSVPQGSDENILLVDPKSSKTPEEKKSPLQEVSSSKRNNESILSNAKEPIVKISPPTPLKKPRKNDAVTIARTNAEEQHGLFATRNKSTIKKVDLYKESESLDVPSKNSIIPHDGLRDGRVYSKRTCPFHRYEPAVKIFDDDIERYLTEDPRISMAWEEKLPQVQDASKYDKDKNKITSVKSKKIKRIIVPRKELEYYPDNAIDLTASRTAEDEFKIKKNDTLDKQYNFKSDVRTSRKFKFSLDKKSMKEKKIKNLKISSFPESFQSQNKIKTTSGKILNKSNLQAPEIRKQFVNEPE